MPAKSKSQQRLFAMVHNCQKTGKCASSEVKKIAKGISYKDADDFASTKHKGLPEKKEESVSFKNLTFAEFVEMKENAKKCQCPCKPCQEGNCAKCSHKDCNCKNCDHS